jgi:deazaflavin-dependent oxidoreductase (nitroreductase family)
MTRPPKKSAAFSAAGRILSRPEMRPLTRLFSNLHAGLYRLTRGGAQNPNYPTMLLTVTGRKSGRSHTVPLIYIEDEERLVIAAAYAGSDSNPAWWLNLRVNPQALAQVNNATFAVEAALAPEEQRPHLWQRLVEMYPYFTDYQQRTTREIPVVILTRTGVRSV